MRRARRVPQQSLVTGVEHMAIVDRRLVCGDERHQAVAPGPRLTDCDQPSVAARLLAQAPERIPDRTAEQDAAAVLPGSSGAGAARAPSCALAWA
jgi:hypothetical protein